MGYTLKVEHPQLPEGTEIGVANFGLIPNGSSVEVSEDDERFFMADKGIPLEDAFKDNAVITLSGNSALSAEEVQSLTAPPPVEGFVPGTEPAPTDEPAPQVQTQEATPSDTTTPAPQGGDVSAN